MLVSIGTFNSLVAESFERNFRQVTFKLILVRFHWNVFLRVQLTHLGRVTHICVGNLTIIGPDNGLSPGRRQAITWTNVGILLIGPLGTNFSEMLIEIHTFSFKKIHLKMSSGKWRPSCLGLNGLTIYQQWSKHRLVCWLIYASLGFNFYDIRCSGLYRSRSTK